MASLFEPLPSQHASQFPPNPDVQTGPKPVSSGKYWSLQVQSHDEDDEDVMGGGVVVVVDVMGGGSQQSYGMSSPLFGPHPA